MIRLPILFCVMIVVACNTVPSADELINQSEEMIAGEDTVKTIIAYADCVSPQGPYTSEIHSGEDDYVYFKQTDSLRERPLEIFVISWGRGGEVVSDTSFNELDSNSIAVIKGHEFHEILTQLRDRFNHFEEPKRVSLEGSNYYKILAKDRQGYDVELFFGVLSKRLERFTILNPANRSEKLLFLYSKWERIENFTMPMRVDIFQNEKKFVFEYTTVLINSKTFHKKANS